MTSTFQRTRRQWFVYSLLLLFLWTLSIAFTDASNNNSFRNHLESIPKTGGGFQNRFFALRHGQSKANVAKLIASTPNVACNEYGLSTQGQLQAQSAGLKLVQDFLEARRRRRRLLQAKESPSTTTTTTTPSSSAGIAIVASDLLRAKETAMALVEAVLEHNENNPDDIIPLFVRDDAANKIVQVEPTIDNNNNNNNNNNNIPLESLLTLDIRLRERGFGDWDLGPDKHYQDVWKDDAVDAYHTLHNVESVWSVVDRSTRCIREYNQNCTNLWIICVAHGDVLQILQTAFCSESSKMDPKDHRSLEHLETAIMRPLQWK